MIAVEGCRPPDPMLDDKVLRDFVDSAGIGLHCVGPTGTILWANRSDFEPFGYQADEYIGRHIGDFHADSEVLEDILARLSRGERLANYEACLRCKDGSKRLVLISSSVRFGEDGEFLHTRCFTVDITERRNNEALLQRQADELRKVGEFRDRFLSIAAHDLRNPLATLVMGTQLLLKHEELPVRLLKVVARMARGAESMSRMITDLFDFTRGRLAGGIPISAVSMDAGDLFARVVDDLDLQSGEAPIVYERRGDLRVFWDPERITQVVSNLVSNALRHGEGPVRITLEAEGATVRLTVQNGGEPIPAEVLPTIFDPFRRGSGRSEGLGLGLYIVSEIVRSHGGTVGVQSAKGEGTTFEVSLPRACPSPRP